MRIDGIGNMTGIQPLQSPIVDIKPLSSPEVNVSEIKTPEAGSSDKSFGSMVKDAIGKVNDLQSNADDMATKFASGDAIDVHQAMIAMQKASTALQFTVQVRNKVLDAYQEIMRMQV